MLKLLATAFRQAIEQSDLRSEEGFREFPRGASSETSLLLSEFLRQHGYAQIDYVEGCAKSGPQPHASHAWLEIGGTIIDITADQFARRPAAPVIVTNDHSWHAHFTEEDRSDARLESLDPRATSHLRQLYKRVAEALPRELRREGPTK
jgi:hypothetical protein